METLLRDPVWQFIGAVIGFIAIIISLWAIIAQQKNKKLIYSILSDTSIISKTDELSGVLSILYNDEPVEDVHLVVLCIENSGKTPILCEDYDRNIRFLFDDRVNILTSEITECKPENLDAEIGIEGKNILALQPLLLNSGDKITFKALICDYYPGIKADGRIVGIKCIKEQSDKPENIASFLILVVALILTFIATIIEINYGKVDIWKVNHPAAKILVIISYICLAVYAVINFKRYTRIFKKFFNKVNRKIQAN